MNKLISVIVPVYNVIEYLPACIESICNQTYHNLEILLVDDGATDGSGEVCDQYSDQDSRIQVIHQQNQGVSAARNNGIAASHGDLFAFVDSDDYLKPNMYERLVHAMDEGQADIVACGFDRIYSDHTDTVTYEEKDYSMEEAVKELITNNMAGGCSPCTKLFRKQVFHNVTFPINRRWEDMMTTYKLYENANKISVIHDSLYNYIQRDTSVTHSQLGIYDNMKITALYDRAIDVAQRFPKLAETEYHKVTLGSMQLCIRMHEAGEGTSANYEATYQLGNKAYMLIQKGKQVSLIRKELYSFFYKHQQVFYRVWKCSSFVLKKLVF